MQVLTSDEIKETLWELKGGSEVAFAKVYGIYSQKLYTSLLYLVKSEEIAKELLQDVFLKIWRQRDSIDLEKSFKSFLFKIGENLVYDYLRKVSRDKKMATKFIEDASDRYSHIEEVLFHKETAWILNQAIESLSPQRKQVFTLCKLEGKSYKEVSEMLGISVSTISDHIVKATRSIKEHLSFNHDIAVSVMVAAVFSNL